MRPGLLLCALLPLWLPAAAAHAQTDADGRTEAAASESAATESAATEAAATEAPVTVVPPVLIVTSASGRVPPELLDAVRARLVEAIAPLAGGRPVRAIGADDPVGAVIAACEDDACVGGAIASVEGIGAIVVTLSRRAARGPVALTLDVRDPVSGGIRLPTQSVALEAEGDLTALDPLIEALRPVMFSPPPPPPELLITVNVDGAVVTIDGERVGATPIAAARLTPGRHAVMVTAVGYSGARREVELDPGERERLDITLVSADAVPMDEVIVADGTVVEGRPWYEEWWVWTIVGGVVVVGVGVGVGVGVAASSGPPPDPMGIPLPPIR